MASPFSTTHPVGARIEVVAVCSSRLYRSMPVGIDVVFIASDAVVVDGIVGDLVGTGVNRAIAIIAVAAIGDRAGRLLTINDRLPGPEAVAVDVDKPEDLLDILVDVAVTVVVDLIAQLGGTGEDRRVSIVAVAVVIMEAVAVVIGEGIKTLFIQVMVNKAGKDKRKQQHQQTSRSSV
jgi:hypothetical protein